MSESQGLQNEITCNPDDSFRHIDLTGMNTACMKDAHVLVSGEEAKRLLNEYKDHAFSIAGMRHSQGGHTALDGGRMLISETLNEIHQIEGGKQRLITVQAGVTWAQLHHFLAPHRLSPRVHQSSGHFTVGGSLSVNCHGREVRWGAISDTVESIRVLTADGATVSASRNDNSNLFWATLGGYGACGLILDATIRLTPNRMLYRTVGPSTGGTLDVAIELEEYVSEVGEIANQATSDDLVNAENRIHLHHGWICTAGGKNYLSKVIPYTAKEQHPTAGNEQGIAEHSSRLPAEGWGTTELLRAGWAASRIDPSFKQQIWGFLIDRNHYEVKEFSRLELLREAILFTSSKGDANGVDMLQEYFVPIDRFVAFMDKLKEIFPPEAEEVQLLSCTTRFVRKQQDQEGPFLSYCTNSDMISVAIDAHVKKSGKEPDPKAADRFKDAIKAAIDCGGSFYLPYYRFASLDQIETAYPKFDQWCKAVKVFNPMKKFNNEFLKSCKI